MNEEIIKGRLTQGPLSDVDSYFAAIDIEDTPHVIEALRRAGVQFDVSINPNPEEDEANCDVFWFWRQADHASIQKAIENASGKKNDANKNR